MSLYFSMKKIFGFGRFLTQKSDIEDPKLANFKPQFQIVSWSNKDLLIKESAIYHSNELWYDAKVVEKFLNGT